MVGSWSPREKNAMIHFDHEIFQNFGKKLSQSLLALHTLIGCDYTASFSRKGKVRPLKNLEKNETAQEIFGCLGDVEEINESMLNVCEEFVCQFYNGKKVKLVNKLRFDMFLTKYKTNDKQHLNEVKKMDASSLPPCQRVKGENRKNTLHLPTLKIINISKSTNSTYTRDIRMEP